MKEKKDGREISLKNIAFEGSARKLSILHPSRNQSLKSRHPSAMMKIDGFDSENNSKKKVENSHGKIPSYKNFDFTEQAPKREKGNSNEHFASDEQIENHQIAVDINETSS